MANFKTYTNAGSKAAFTTWHFSIIRRRALVAMMVIGLTFTAAADTSSISISGTSVTTSGSGGTLSFPITRGGDTSYDAYVEYHTTNGSAVAGTDYTATAGTLRIPAGTGGATIPVPVAAGSGADKTLQMLLDGAGGVGPMPSFAAALEIPVAGGLPNHNMAVADLNGDGKPDLAITNGGGDTVSILFNTTASGTAIASYTLAGTFPVGYDPRPIVAADFNGDGKTDLALVNIASGTLTILLNTTAPGAASASFSGSGSFGNTVAIGRPSIIQMLVADFNGDGKPDVAISNMDGNSVSVLLNTTPAGAMSTSFGSITKMPVGSAPRSLAVGDFNGDGKPDLVAPSQDGNTLSIMFNTTEPGAKTATFSPPIALSGFSGPVSIAVDDFNGDGKLDLAVTNTTANTVSILLNATAPGAGTPSFQLAGSPAVGNFPIVVMAGDLNGDGKPDLAVINLNDNTVSVLTNATVPGGSTASFSLAGSLPVGTTTNFEALSDLNGDGQLDLVTVTEQDTGASILLNTTLPQSAATRFNPPVSSPAAGAPYHNTAVGDFNGDGKPDLAITNGGDDTVSILFNISMPAAGSPNYVLAGTLPTGLQPRAIAVGDFNGDGKLDLAVADFGSGKVSILLNTTASGATAASFSTLSNPVSSGRSPILLAVEDFNGDGKPDLAIANQASNSVSVLLNTTMPGASTAKFGAATSLPTGGGPRWIAVGDFNGDGKPDLATPNQNDDTVSILFNTTGSGAKAASFTPAATLSGFSGPVSITVGDFNDDGKLDLGVANSSSNTVAVMLNATATGATSASFILAGSPVAGNFPNGVLTADFNGDGKPDLAVLNLNSSNLSILLNTTVPGAATASFSLVASPAVNINPNFITLGDLNNDGKPDLIVSDQYSTGVSILINGQYQAVLGASVATGTIHYP